VALVFLADAELAAAFASDPVCRSERHEILLAPTGAQLLALASRQRPNLVLVPDTLSDMPALQCCRKMRQLVGPSGTLIVLITRQTSPDLAMKASVAGCDRVVQMPVSRDVFYELLKTVVPAAHKGQVRVAFEGPIELGDGRTAQAHNISQTGMRLDLHAPLPPGARLKLTVRLPRIGNPVQLEAVVVWSRPKADGVSATGVRFVNVSRFDQQVLNVFVMTAKRVLQL
jgi:DNA-binding response OmpR family regulator